MTKYVTIYTDGACRGNPGVGGWAAVLRYDGREKQLYNAEKNTTNNRMELTAALEALKALKRPCHIKLHTDSNYLQKGITKWITKWQKNGWQTANRQPVKNADLWRQLLVEVARHKISWHWVKGHAGHPGNEQADQLANKAIDELL